MIKSINRYHGFYVSRYEMNQGNGNYSKINIQPASAINSETEKWYGLYNKANGYTNTNKTQNSSVISQMIWGSQYDAMINFALPNLENSNNINNPLINGISKTGIYFKGKDAINNIFDLNGNLMECTREWNYLEDAPIVRSGGVRNGSIIIGGRSVLSNMMESRFIGARMSLYVTSSGEDPNVNANN